MTKRIRLLFSVLFLVTFFSFFSVAENSSGYPTIRRASFEKIQKFRSEKVFNYEKDYSPSTSFWDRLKRWFWEHFFKSINGSFIPNPWHILIGIITIALILYYLITSDRVGLFSKKSKNNTIAITSIDENIEQFDVGKFINEAIENKNYRIAIRYLYLKSLKELSLKELISWKVDKTNRDYINELRQSVFEKTFEEITYLFDYAWYGSIEINEITFQNIKNIFDRFYVQIHSKT